MATDAPAEEPSATWASLGVCDTLCEACTGLGWKEPTAIQRESLPAALDNKDVIGLAETGSGKTAAFAIPILQSLLDTPRRIFALVLAPTRELAYQINEQFEALGADIGLKTAVIVGGVDIMTQAVALARKPHVIIATPGRIVDHLENTKVRAVFSAPCRAPPRPSPRCARGIGEEEPHFSLLAPRGRVSTSARSSTW